LYDVWFVIIHSFFFSSRRRHTRFSRDWSSDVCSSDLRRRQGGTHRSQGDRADAGAAIDDQAAGARSRWPPYRRLQAGDLRQGRRSEERRVGKEWRLVGVRRLISAAELMVDSGVMRAIV